MVLSDACERVVRPSLPRSSHPQLPRATLHRIPSVLSTDYGTWDGLGSFHPNAQATHSKQTQLSIVWAFMLLSSLSCDCPMEDSQLSLLTVMSGLLPPLPEYRESQRSLLVLRWLNPDQGPGAKNI